MVKGWRKAFSSKFLSKDRDTMIPTEKALSESNHGSRFSFFSNSNPSTPRLKTKTLSLPNSPKHRCNSGNGNGNPKFLHHHSPKSPSASSFLTLPVPKSRCGICFESVKSGKETAIFTPKCSHSFHFNCISSAHINKHKILVCPVCSPLRQTKALRIYDDDEPLRTPITIPIPIPESNENEDEENSSLESTTENLQVSLMPESAVVSVAKRSETFAVILKVKAPISSRNHRRRVPIDLVMVIDVSLSINGDKLQMIKKTMRLIISSLQCTDRLSILAFSSTSKRLLPLKRMTGNGRRSAFRIVDALGEIGQNSCVNDALKKAIKVLDDRRERNPFATILLLSESQDDRAFFSYDQNRFPFVSSMRFSPSEIPVHFVNFHPKVGACVDAPPDVAISTCVRDLLSMVAQDLKIHLGLLSGSAPAEIAAVYSVSGRFKAIRPGSVQVGNLYAGEVCELLLEMKVPTSSVGSHHVLSVGSTFKNPSSQTIVNFKEQALPLPKPRAVRSSTLNIERLRNFHITIRAMVESRRLLDQNNLSAAYNVLSSAQSFVKQRNSASSSCEYLRGLDMELAELSRHSQRQKIDEEMEPIGPASAWRAAERLAKVAISRKSMNRVSDLHGFENARF